MVIGRIVAQNCHLPAMAVYPAGHAVAEVVVFGFAVEAEPVALL
jgi:hypothetical protein